jgi:hypothetical protein
VFSLHTEDGPPAAPAIALRRAAPALDTDATDIRAELADGTAPRVADTVRSDRLSTGADAAPGLPFSGLTVADFSWVGVGPISGKFLADHGAQVIRIESEARPDVLIESFAPGVIGRFGLGYDEVRKIRPDIIMISTA